ncbi:hypothetical protein [Mesorhizobium sp. M0317]
MKQAVLADPKCSTRLMLEDYRCRSADRFRAKPGGMAIWNL